jgi:molybdopterin-guanine dinucleotide biosynthesis protein A
MGRAKAWLPWRGRPMLSHVVSILRDAVADVIVVAAPGQDLPEVDARVVRDAKEGLGPLAGIAAGLSHAPGELAYVTATDAPYLTAEFVRCLLGQGRAAAPVVDGFVQTLSAVYPTNAAATAETLLAQGRRRPLDLLEAVGFRKVPVEALPDRRCVQGFNTPDAYLAAVRELEPHASAVFEGVGEVDGGSTACGLEVPVDSLAAILGRVEGALELAGAEHDSQTLSVSLDGRPAVLDVRAPLGPDEHVRVRGVVTARAES